MVIANIIGGVIGSVLPLVIDAIAGSKNEKEARAAVYPQRMRIVDELVGRGTPRAEAEATADKAIESEVSAKMEEGVLPGWATAALSLAGGIGGGFAGSGVSKMISSRGMPKMLPHGAADLAEDAAPVKELAKPFGGSARPRSKPWGTITKDGRPLPTKQGPAYESEDLKSMDPSKNVSRQRFNGEDAKTETDINPIRDPDAGTTRVRGAVDDRMARTRPMEGNRGLNETQRMVPAINPDETQIMDISNDVESLLPPELLPVFAKMAQGMKAQDASLIRRRMDRY